jgi:hypothetical protein
MEQIDQFSFLGYYLDIAEVEGSPIVLVLVGGVARLEHLVLRDWYAVRHGDVEGVNML